MQSSQPKVRPFHKMLEFTQIYFSDKMTLNGSSILNISIQRIERNILKNSYNASQLKIPLTLPIMVATTTIPLYNTGRLLLKLLHSNKFYYKSVLALESMLGMFRLQYSA